MLPRPLHSRILLLSNILQGIFHIPISADDTRLAYRTLDASALIESPESMGS